MKTIIGCRIGVAIAVVVGVFGIPFRLSADTAPSSYTAYTGTDPKPVPSAPSLGPANSVITDPTFGSRILRVTDQNTKSGRSFISIDAGFFRAWNADSTAIKLTGPQGDGYWLEFNPTTFKVGDGSSIPTVHSVPFGATWEWSMVDPNIMYYLNGNQIAKYNKSTGSSTNLGGPSNGDPLGYMAVVVGQDSWVCAAAGPGFQDSRYKIFCINPASPSISKFIDVYNKTINGVPQGDPNWPTSASGKVIGIHDIAGGTGTSWLEVTFHQHSWGGNGGSVFNLATNTWSLVTNADFYWSGHVSMGNGKYANSSGSINGLDSRGMVLRNPDNLMNSAEYKFISQPRDSANGWCDSDHSSWLNSLTNPNAPILISRFGGSSSCYQHGWAGEIVAAAVDGSNTVWRFAHNHNAGFSCYYSQAFAQISNDGKWALFSSYWDGTLGTDTAFGCSNRIDTFIVDLMSAGAIDSSPPIISSVSIANITASTASVSWITNEPADGQVEFLSACPSTGCLSALNSNLVTSHTINVGGLAPSTMYSYRVRSRDSAGNLAISTSTTFVTSAMSSTLQASYLGVTGQDYVGPVPWPNGNPDWHIQLSGLRGTPTRVRITSNTGGVWENPYNGSNWSIYAQVGSSGTGDLWYEPWPSQTFHVKVWYSDQTTDEVDATNSYTTLKASYLGVTGQDYIGPQGTLTPNGNLDWHIQLSGLRGTPTKVQITSNTGGVWEAPYNGYHWGIYTQFGQSGTGDLWYEPWPSQTFHVKVWYGDQTTDEADATNNNTGTLRASYLGVTGQDYVGPEGTLTPNGIADWHIRLSGLRGIPTKIQITSNTGGVWEIPYNGSNWVIYTQFGASGTGDLWYEPWFSQTFHVRVWYSDQTTDEADAL
jgi:hypothetical protein